MANLLFLAAYALTLASIVDNVYHMIITSNNNKSSSSDHRYTIQLYVTLSLRIVGELVFVLFGIFSPRRHHGTRLIVYTFATVTTVNTVLMIVITVFMPYHDVVLSFAIQLCTIYLMFCCFMQELFALHGIVDLDGNSSKDDDDRGYKIRTEKNYAKFLRIIQRNMMAITTLLAVAMSIILGILMRQSDPIWTERQLMYLGFPGEIFLRMLKCLILPLIFSSMVFAIGNIDAQLSGKIALRAMVYYFSTTLLAIIIGIILVVTIRPGARTSAGELPNDNEQLTANKITTLDTILDLVRNIFPSNIFEATFSYYNTVLKCNATLMNCDSIDLDRWQISSSMQTGSSNFLGIVMFAAVFGVMISRIEQRELMVNLFKSINDIMMKMTTEVIRFTPIGVIFLILPEIIKVTDLNILFGAIGWYTICVIIGILLQAFITLPLIYFVLTRKNPFQLLKHLSSAIITAFGTSSSSATMPVTFTCLEEKAQLDKRIVRFCIPIGSTINMDGTALYEAVAAIFIAQYRDVEMDIIKVIIIAITATAASIGAAGIPQAGLVTMIIVLNAVGLQTEDAALIVVVDWMLDRLRTVLNVLGDSFGAAIVDHLSRHEIDEIDNLPTLVHNGIHGYGGGGGSGGHGEIENSKC